MKLVIFGATGGTGSQLLTRALDGGHEVTIIARTPDKAARRGHDNLTVLVGDVLEPSTWVAGMAGHDAVLSCLGSTDRKRPTTVYSRGTANIIDAMRTSGVRRLMCLSSAGLEIAPDTPLPVRLVTSVVIQRLYRHGYADMAIMERTVATSDTDWTVIRAPMLTDGPFTGRYRTEANRHLATSRSVSRADLAHYMLGHVQDRRTWKATIEISQ